MYVRPNFKTKKALKEAIANGQTVKIYQPGLGEVPSNGWTDAEGPYAPEAHTWYANIFMVNGIVTKVK